MPFIMGFALGGYVFDNANRPTPPNKPSGLYTGP